MTSNAYSPAPKVETFDMVDEMMWEDLTEFLTLEEAGLESSDFDTVPAIQRELYFNLES